MSAPPNDARLARWRLVLGSEADASCGAPEGPGREVDRALAAVYEPTGPDGLKKRRGGRGGSTPHVARWLGDIRRFFPTQVVQVLQRDALERLELHEMLMQPELLEAVQPDVHLVASLLALKNVMPAKTRETARSVVRKVTDDLMRRLEMPLRSAVTGALDRSHHLRRPRHVEVDWNRTILANLKHFQPTLRTVIPETLVGWGRKARRPQRDVILCIDQSGSMAASVVYASIFGAVLASLPVLRTRLVVFDTSVVDLSEELRDPVDLLFGVQLGGGTDIERAVAYCAGLVRDPRRTIFVLVSDLQEGGVADKLVRRAAALVGAGVTCVALLALSDEGAPAYDPAVAAKLATIGVPSFACTPDAFPGLMAAAIRREDVTAWAAARGIVTSRPDVERG